MTVTTPPPLRPLWRQLTWWTLAFPVVMIVAIARHDTFLLNWIHLLSGALWTGAAYSWVSFSVPFCACWTCALAPR